MFLENHNTGAYLYTYYYYKWFVHTTPSCFTVCYQCIQPWALRAAGEQLAVSWPFIMSWLMELFVGLPLCFRSTTLFTVWILHKQTYQPSLHNTQSSVRKELLSLCWVAHPHAGTNHKHTQKQTIHMPLLLDEKIVNKLRNPEKHFCLFDKLCQLMGNLAIPQFKFKHGS